MSSGVEFEEPEFINKNFMPRSHTSAISSYLIKNGWAHDQSSANRLLVFLIILIVLASGIIYYLFVVRAQNGEPIRLPETIVNKLSPETQAKLRASQR